MPVVPTYDTPQVAPAGLPNAQVQGLSPRALMQGEIGGHEMESTGQAAMSYGIGAVNAEANSMMMANQVVVDDGINKARAARQKLANDPETGYLSKMGDDALRPNAQGQGLADNYTQQLNSQISAISDSMGNDAQRQVFARQVAPLITEFSGQVQSHALREHQSFGLKTQQGTIELASDDARRNWLDPNALSNDPADQAQSVILRNLLSARSAVWKAGQLNGDPANLTDAKTEQVLSSIHSGVIMAALQNNRPDYAQQYIQKFAPDMTAGDLLKASGNIEVNMRDRNATGAAQSAITAYQSAFNPTIPDRMAQITAQAESGAQDFKADGSAVTSSAGAKYKMQVMPATAANPGHGIKPASDDSPAQYNNVGTQLLNALVKKYSGSSSKAWAAYNAGEGNVDNAIKDAGPGGDWMGALAQYQSPANHAQTLAYVQNNVKQLQNGGGIPPMPSLQDIHQAIRGQFGPNADSQTVSKALAEGTRQYSDIQKDRVTQTDNLMQSAQQYAIQTNGDLNSMPPEMKAQITALAPEKWPELQKFYSAIANPPKVDNLVELNNAYNHPEMLTNLSNSGFQQFLTNFTPETQKQIQQMRSKNVKGEQSVDMSSVNEILNNRLRSIDVETKPTTDAGKQQIGTIQKQIYDGILEQQSRLGRQFNYAEVSKFIDTQILRSTNIPGMLWGSTSKATLSMTPSDIPSAQLDQVKAALARQGAMNPSSDQIMRTYWSVKQPAGAPASAPVAAPYVAPVPAQAATPQPAPQPAPAAAPQPSPAATQPAPAVPATANENDHSRSWSLGSFGQKPPMTAAQLATPNPYFTKTADPAAVAAADTKVAAAQSALDASKSAAQRLQLASVLSFAKKSRDELKGGK